ncbi:CinA family protein [Alloscardovia omnicolens]|uniref:CinA family protein n=1 Tax=Alloscardovia omnicolens TaxID=419015 RepID=UPI003A6716BC
MTGLTLEKQDEYARLLLERCRMLGIHICCAESLTGGLLCDAFVRIPGASDTFRGGVNTYAVDTKASILGVDRAFLDEHGPVNFFTAQHMAQGALQLFDCDGIALSTTGVAGPGPDGDIPAGTVYIGCARSGGKTLSVVRFFSGSRAEVRHAAVCAALEYAVECLEDECA